MDFDIILLLQNLACCFLETIFFSVLAYAVTQSKPTDILHNLIKMAIFSAILAALSYVGNSSLFFRAILIFVTIIFFYSLLGINFVHSIYVFIISYICTLVIQLCIILVFTFTATMQDTFVIQLFANILTIVGAIIVRKWVPIHLVYRFILKKDIAFRFFLGNTFVIIFLINYLVVAHLSHFIYYFITIIIVVGLLVFVNVELLRSRVIVDKQKAIIDNYNKYLPIVDELIEQVRGRQHGYDNNIQSLSALAMTCNDYESLRSELLKNIDVMSHSDLPIFLLKFNLKLLSGLLFQKYSVAAKQGIHMDFTIKNYNIQSAVPEYIIVEAVGILMDNAIEASSENDTIYITIDCTQNKFHFHIMNVGPTFTSEFYKNIFTRGYTTKSSTGRNHGLGLNHLLEMSKKYNGRLGVGNEQRRGTEYLFFSIDL